MRIPLIVLLVLFQAVLVSAKNVTSSFSDQLKVLDLYYVRDGAVQKESFNANQLRSRTPTVNGYVCGVVLFCKEGVTAKVEGREMNPIRRNDDGTVSLKYFRSLSLDELSLPETDKTYYQKLFSSSEKNLGGQSFLPGGYSLFSRVTGDAVSPNQQFDITLANAGRTIEIPVRQDDCRTVKELDRTGDGHAGRIAFRYLGNRLDRFQSQTRRFEKRLDAIASGISAVENRLGVDLVRCVNIIDYSGIRNAVTCDGENDIWFYASTFQEEPVNELKTIAEHESLHIYVSRNGLSGNHDVRKLFSDLKHYDLFSMERFSIMTAGTVPPGNGESASDDNIFFDFINEKNFLKGMKGGHSHENIDEFCVSFLHSLVYFDRMEENLNLPVNGYFSDAKAPQRFLTPSEQVTVLDNYIRSIGVLMGALSENNRFDHHPVLSILRQKLAQARQIREDLMVLCLFPKDSKEPQG